MGGELEAGGVGEQPGGGLQADAQPVVLQQLARERVVGGDPRLAGRLLVEGLLGDAGFGEGLADALRQFTGGLVRKRQAEDPVGRHLSGAHQPDNARGHHRRLAGTGSGHDDLRGGRRGDARHLLGGEGDAEELLELLGVGQAGGSRHPR
ncbi:hypothetical protein GCM10020000_27560 [Streptomyces olivoverticillatus]